MMSYFTDTYPDEIMYYILSRLYRDGDYTSREEFIKDVFGSDGKISSPLFMKRVEKILGNLPSHHAYSIDYFLNKHTILPALTPFITYDRFVYIKEKFLNLGSISDSILVAFENKQVSQENLVLRCCPNCAKQDVLKFGEPYLHRVHQFYDVLVCPHCKVWLIDITFPVTSAEEIMFFTLDETKLWEKEPRYVDDKDSIGNILWRYAIEIQWLLQQPVFKCNSRNIIDGYIQILIDRGFSNSKGTLKWREITREFKEFYSAKNCDFGTIYFLMIHV
jgi:hypothetical protein